MATNAAAVDGTAKGTKQVNVNWKDGAFPFRCFDNGLSLKTARDIFAGKIYKPVPLLCDVKLIADIGANVGAASVYLHLQYPQARIVAAEPSPSAFALLAENARRFPQIEARQTGLYDKKAKLPLHAGRIDGTTSSFGASAMAKREGEILELEDAAGFFTREGLLSADIVKLDTEGCEWPILKSLEPWLGRFKVIYMEYHSEIDRRRIDALLDSTHLLRGGKALHPHRGEFCYLARSALPADSIYAQLEIRPPQL